MIKFKKNILPRNITSSVQVSSRAQARSRLDLYCSLRQYPDSGVCAEIQININFLQLQTVTTEEKNSKYVLLKSPGKDAKFW